MRPMPSIATSRLLLFADGPRAADPDSATKIRRYRLARLAPQASRDAAGEPRYAYLKRSYD